MVTNVCKKSTLIICCTVKVSWVLKCSYNDIRFCGYPGSSAPLLSINGISWCVSNKGRGWCEFGSYMGSSKYYPFKLLNIFKKVQH